MNKTTLPYTPAQTMSSTWDLAPFSRVHLDAMSLAVACSPLGEASRDLPLLEGATEEAIESTSE